MSDVLASNQFNFSNILAIIAFVPFSQRKIFEKLFRALGFLVLC